MSKSICITQKKFPSVKNINPPICQEKSVNVAAAKHQPVSVPVTECAKPTENKSVETQNLNQPRSTFWGSAVDIEL